MNAGRIISEGAGLGCDVAQEIVSLIGSVATGKLTKAEQLGHVEFVLTYKDFFYFGQSKKNLMQLADGHRPLLESSVCLS